MFKLPVSIGEAIDKLTILDIKIRMIKETERNAHCKVEYDALYEQLKECIDENKFYYNQLKDINTRIWQMQHDIRTSNTPSTKLCLDILNTNDSRFRIKNMINSKFNSVLREQKGYSLKKLFILPHQGLGDHVNLIGAVRYFSLMYDEVHIGCYEGDWGHMHPKSTIENVKSFYTDNSNIKVISLPGAYWQAGDDDKLNSIVNLSSYDKIYRLGYQSNPSKDLSNLPDDWYNELAIPTTIRKEYFYVPNTPGSVELYANIKSFNYIFLHQKSTCRLSNLVKWNIDEILTISPDINVYKTTDKWFAIAELFISKPFWMYYDTIANADELHLTNSSFFCMAMLLHCKATKRICYSRHGDDVDEYYTNMFIQ